MPNRRILLALGVALASCGGSHGSRPRHLPAATPSAAPYRARPPAAPIAGAAPSHSAELPSVSIADVEPRARVSALGPARRAAERFFASYVELLYGPLPASRVPNVDGDVRAQLEHGHALVTPAERAAHARLARVSVALAGPPVSAVASATVDAGGEIVRLTATLEPHRGRWLVVAVGG